MSNNHSQSQNNGEGHNHSISSLENINRAFYIGIGLNSIFTIIEFVVGYFTNSLALMADASHNLSDVISLIISLIGMRLAQKTATYLYTYGYKKASILASLINSVLLIIIVVKIFIEAIERFSAPQDVVGIAIIITAIIGVFINALSAYLFYKGQKQDINIKGAFLHLVIDAVVSLGVVISGIVIYYTGWNIIDPMISVVIVFVILFSTWNLLKESIRLTLDGVPKNIDVKEIENLLLNNKMIKNIHHLHIWALSSSENALTVHVILNEDFNVQEFLCAKSEIKHELEHNNNIHHSTIELDDSFSECKDINCN